MKRPGSACRRLISARPPTSNASASPQPHARSQPTATAAECGHKSQFLDLLERTILLALSAGAGSGKRVFDYAARMSQLRKSSRTASQVKPSDSIDCGALSVLRSQRCETIVKDLPDTASRRADMAAGDI